MSFPAGFNVVDALVGVFLLAGLVGGVRRGLSGELARAVIAVACIAVAALYARPLADWAMGRFDLTPRQAYGGALFALLLGAYAALTAVRLLLGVLLVFHFKGKLELFGGALCGLLRSAVVLCLVLLLLSLMPNPKLHEMITQDSFAGRTVLPHMRPMYETLSERVPELRLPEGAAAGLDRAADEAGEAKEWAEEQLDLGPAD